MAVSKVGVIAAVVMCMVVVSQHVEVEGLTCAQVTGKLRNCLQYLKGAGALPPGCCMGVQNLNNSAKSTPDRKQACTCLKSIAATLGINYNIAAGLPRKCGVSIPYKISRNTDCSKVK